MSTHTPGPWRILADAVCANCQTRIGWHDQYVGCSGFSVENPAQLRSLYDSWFAENEPTTGFRNDDDVPRYVLIARAAIAKAEGKA